MKVTFDSTQIVKEATVSTTRQKGLRSNFWTQVRVVSFEAERFIKLRMPVDTGRARASWGHSSAPAAAGEGVWEEREATLSLTQGSRVPYMGALNEGHSQQAPAGFIDAEASRAGERLAGLIGKVVDEAFT